MKGNHFTLNISVLTFLSLIGVDCSERAVGKFSQYITNLQFILIFKFTVYREFTVYPEQQSFFEFYHISFTKSTAFSEYVNRSTLCALRCPSYSASRAIFQLRTLRRRKNPSRQQRLTPAVRWDFLIFDCNYSKPSLPRRVPRRSE